jgi:hypothetical protein
MNKQKMRMRILENFIAAFQQNLVHRMMFLGGEISEVEADVNSAYNAEDDTEMKNSRLVYVGLMQAWVGVAELLLATTKPNGTFINTVANTTCGMLKGKIVG